MNNYLAQDKTMARGISGFITLLFLGLCIYLSVIAHNKRQIKTVKGVITNPVCLFWKKSGHKNRKKRNIYNCTFVVNYSVDGKNYSHNVSERYSIYLTHKTDTRPIEGDSYPIYYYPDDPGTVKDGNATVSIVGAIFTSVFSFGSLIYFASTFRN